LGYSDTRRQSATASATIDRVRQAAAIATCAQGLVLVAGGCGGDDSTSATGADLVVTVWPSGPARPERRHHVTCPGDAGCRGLSAARLRPVAPNVACTQIYGGPATARVRGTLHGKPVDARFDRTNGCEIARWERNAALLRGG
jgi:hypothetical protein